MTILAAACGVAAERRSDGMPPARRRGVGELGTFRTSAGDLVRCQVDPSGRVATYREEGGQLVPCDPRVLLDAVQLSDDPRWLSEHEPASAGNIPGD